MLYRMYTSFNVKHLQRCEESSLIHEILSDTAQSMFERTMHLTLLLVRQNIIYTTHFAVSNIYKHLGKKTVCKDIYAKKHYQSMIEIKMHFIQCQT